MSVHTYEGIKKAQLTSRMFRAAIEKWNKQNDLDPNSFLGAQMTTDRS